MFMCMNNIILKCSKILLLLLVLVFLYKIIIIIIITIVVVVIKLLSSLCNLYAVPNVVTDEEKQNQKQINNDKTSFLEYSIPLVNLKCCVKVEN